MYILLLSFGVEDEIMEAILANVKVRECWTDPQANIAPGELADSTAEHAERARGLVAGLSAKDKAFYEGLDAGANSEASSDDDAAPPRSSSASASRENRGCKSCAFGV